MERFRSHDSSGNNDLRRLTLRDVFAEGLKLVSSFELLEDNVWFLPETGTQHCLFVRVT